MSRSLWRNRDFLLLFTAQIISLLGSGMTTIGLTLLIYRIAGSSVATVVIGQALMLRILAFLLFSQPAGILADHIDRKRILITADVGRFALLAFLPFVTATWQIYVMIFSINALTAFFTPTFEATIPEIAGKDNYVQALSLSRVASDVEAVASPALAGILVAMWGIRWVFWFDAFTYLVSVTLVTMVSIPQLPRIELPLSFRSFLAEITTGTRILLREAALRQALLLSLAEATAGASAIVLTAAYVHDVLSRSDETFAFMMAAVGLGSSLTGISLSWWSRKYEQSASGAAQLHGKRHQWTGRILIWGGFLLAAVLLPGAARPGLWAFALLWVGNGVGQALIAIPSSTLLAEHTTTEERGRAYAAHFALTHLCWLITYPLAGWVGAKAGPPLAFSLFGVACIAIGIIAVLMGRGSSTPHVHFETEQLRHPA